MPRKKKEEILNSRSYPPKNQLVTFKVSNEEFAFYKAYAETYGYASLSEFLRECIEKTVRG